MTVATAPTLVGRLLEQARLRPDAVAIRNKHLGIWREESWAAYQEHVASVAHALAGLGVGPGDHVAILSDNRPEWLYADLAAQALGARSVGIYQTNPAADVAYILSHSRSRVLVCEDQEQVDKAIEVAAETPSVEHVVVIEPRGTRHYEDARLLTWDELLERGRAAHASDAGWLADRVAERSATEAAMIVYTSGTTGDPKGAMISAQNALAVPDGMVEVLAADHRDQILSYLPLCHVAEKIFSLFVPLTTGATVHFGEALDTVRDDLREVSPTVFLGVPRIWEKMHASVVLKMQDSSWLKRTLFSAFTRIGRRVAGRRRRGEHVGAVDRVLWRLGDLLVFRPLQERLGLRRCWLPVTGAAPISADLLDWFDGIGVTIVEGYGQTECAGVSHVNRMNARRLGTVGTPLPGVEQRLDDDGEILVRGDGVFLGYLHQPEATATTVTPEGWLRTGDVGVIDEDGSLRITGRKKEIIITAGGKNLSPEKIENALKTSPYIKEVVAIGDRRKFIAALIQIDRDAVSDWAQRDNIPFTSFADLAARPEVVDRIRREVDTANDLLARVEHVRAFRLLPRELNQDDGELTATQKVRRRAVMERWGQLVESMYGAGG